MAFLTVFFSIAIGGYFSTKAYAFTLQLVPYYTAITILLHCNRYLITV